MVHGRLTWTPDRHRVVRALQPAGSSGRACALVPVSPGAPCALQCESLDASRPLRRAPQTHCRTQSSLVARTRALRSTGAPLLLSCVGAQQCAHTRQCASLSTGGGCRSRERFGGAPDKSGAVAVGAALCAHEHPDVTGPALHLALLGPFALFLGEAVHVRQVARTAVVFSRRAPVLTAGLARRALVGVPVAEEAHVAAETGHGAVEEGTLHLYRRRLAHRGTAALCVLQTALCVLRRRVCTGVYYYSPVGITEGPNRDVSLPSARSTTVLLAPPG